MTHHRAKRDPSTGRFIKPTPSERVAAHVERVNERHPEPSHPLCPAHHAGSTLGVGGGAGAYQPQRSQPIEYATSPHLIRWEILGMEIGD
jgi:hypothetical protein